jgi:hypothetical protein
MFVERKVRYSALFTNLVRWLTSSVCFPLSDVIFVQLACRLSDVKYCLHSGITNLSLYKHCIILQMHKKALIVWKLKYYFWLRLELAHSSC